MFFAGLFAMYFTLRGEAPGEWAAHTHQLNVPFALLNTSVLVASSFTAQAGVWAAERYQRRRTGPLWNIRTWGTHEWFVTTYIMGSFFIAGQVFEYSELVHEGLTISSSPYGSAFYLATGFHGLHVLGGLIAMLFVLGRSFVAKKFGDARSDHHHRRVVLLALCRCGLGRAVPRHLRSEVGGTRCVLLP